MKNNGQIPLEKIKNLKDGESIRVGDFWDVDMDQEETLAQIKNLLTSQKERDFSLAHGRTKIRSYGNFNVVREGDKLKIQGDVDHVWNDPFDFNDGEFLGKQGRVLERRKGAKPYTLKGKWRRKLEGTADLKDGQIGNHQFIWKDVDE